VRTKLYLPAVLAVAVTLAAFVADGILWP